MEARVKDERPTHLDLFSGIGGFALAAQWAGFRTSGFCEIEPYAQRVLARNFGCRPDGQFSIRKFSALVADTGQQRLEKYKKRNGEAADRLNCARRRDIIGCRLFEDIRSLDGSEFAGVSLITGGFPCQPFSCAGKRRGTADDRHLWPEMLRVIAEARPAWVLGENVAGIINMELDTVLSDLEGIGYACRPFVIPACGVDARHRRNRVWVVANASERRCGGTNSGEVQFKGRTTAERGSEDVPDSSQIGRRQGSQVAGRPCEETGASRDGRGSANGDSVLADPECVGQSGSREHERCLHAAADGDRETDRTFDGSEGDAATWLPEPDVGRVAHGIPARVDRLRGLGNAIVPQVAFQILKAIRELI
jgi:DNA (cytosine-5)-methyltransferase 1